MTHFSPSWPPFSFSMGPVDPRVENPGKNIAPASVKCYRYQIFRNSVCYCTQGEQNWLIYDLGFDGNFLQPNLSKLLTKLFCDGLCNRMHKFLRKLLNKIQNHQASLTIFISHKFNIQNTSPSFDETVE